MSNQVARNSYERYAGTPDDRWQLTGNQSLPGGGTGNNNIIFNNPVVYNLNNCYYMDGSNFIHITQSGLYALNMTLQIAQTSGQPTDVVSWIYIQHGDQAGESAATTYNIYPAITGLNFTYNFCYLASVSAGDLLSVRVLNHDVIYTPQIDKDATELRISKVL
jgi:hypothetical protein